MAQPNHGHSHIISPESLRYIVNHVFLPPQLPQADDYKVEHEEALLESVLRTLSSFKNHVQDYQAAVVEMAIDSLQTLHHSQDSTNSPSIPDEKQLLNAFEERLIQKHGMVVFHVRAQNAGIMFTRSHASVQVEMFELSPDNKAVISTEGRLRRFFPGSAVAIPLETFQLPTFQATVAHTLSKMNCQRAPDTKPQIKKGPHTLDEDRETTHPKMITELFSAVLLSVGSSAEVATICKHTREEVFWKDCLMPWHRSASWLLIRVTLQIQFSRPDISSSHPEQTYKTYILLFMAEVLTRAHTFNLPSDLLSAMSAKLSRRYQKISESTPKLIRDFVGSTLLTTNKILEERWLKIQGKHHLSYNMESLHSLKFDQDINISLPKLEDFINSANNRVKSSDNFTFKMSCPLDTHDASKIPSLRPALDSAEATYKLAALESWVATNLGEWLTRHEADPGASGVLRQLIEDYHEAALGHYKSNPEVMSIMVLTILELWIGIDKLAVQICGLLEDYKPGIPQGLLENLNLPLKMQMERLQAIEKYLKHRSARAGNPFYEVLGSFGNPCCFPVRYFDQSAEHQDLLYVIEQDAERDRQAKREEFQSKRGIYNDLMQRFDQIEHTTVANVDSITGSYSDTCIKGCQKCRLRQNANELSIEIHEWPLPEDKLRAKSTVFELRVPYSFGHWRDTTVFILSSVLESIYQVEKKPRATYLLSNNRCSLAHKFQPFDVRQRITLLSEIKPHMGTHRRVKEIITQTEDDVCLQNGLHFQYFDKEMSCFVIYFKTTQNIPMLCTYAIPGQLASEVSPLQQFIHRPAQEPNGPSPNKVLATQWTCPSNLSLEEYKALTSLPLGYRIQWQNILVQLALPSVDFRKQETVLVILQCIFQAGPCVNGNVLRDSHSILDNEHFSHALLISLYEALHRIEENWQSFQAVGVLVSMARRLLSLTPAEDMRLKCVEFLAITRKLVLMKWIDILEENILNTTDGDTRIDLRSKLTKIALICADSFNVDDEHLRNYLASPDHATIMIRCAILIQEGLHCIPRTTKDLTSIMHRRWERLAFRALNVLSDEIIRKNNPALNNAIKESWPGFNAVSQWRVLGVPYHHWLEGSALEGENDSPLIHFSLLTGELLVNGSPLSRLPKGYEEHCTYKMLFGKSILEVMPSTVPGMRFSSKKAFNGHRIHLGLDSADENLFIQADAESQTFEFIPRHILRDSFPTVFVDKFIHWYNKTNDCVEFCAHELPWSHSEQNWRLVRSWNISSSWQLTKGNSFLINCHSHTAVEISRILSPLEESVWMHVILQNSSLDIELPRLKIGFYLRQGETSIASRQFRGMLVDEDQTIGTLTGLRSKLVLKGPDDRLRRKIIIPSGNITFSKRSQHVQVQIANCSNTKVHAYDVDDLLGRLINNSSLQSKLWISYLHAITSFPLPDQLTGKTGTEQALTILNSAATRSFRWLTQEDIDLLTKIASLTPERVYYPAEQRVMQTVHWSPTLNSLAQHGEFYQAVRSIFHQAEELKFFYPESYVPLTSLQHVEQSLLRRDLIRSSTFFTSGFGAENYTADCDRDYSSRDHNNYSAQASRAFAMSSMVFRESFSLQRHIGVDLASYIWQFLTRAAMSPIHGLGHIFPASQLKYDARFLRGSSVFIAEHWICFHKLLSSPISKPDKFQMMFWLATVSYAQDSDMDILQVLASFYAQPEMRHVIPPNNDRYDLSLGSHIDDLEATLGLACYQFKTSPESRLSRNQGESTKQFQARKSRLYRDNKDRAIAKLSSALKAQWPRETPTYPDIQTRVELCQYMTVDSAMSGAIDYFKPRFHNYQLVRYLRRIGDIISREVATVQMSRNSLSIAPYTPVKKSRFVRNDDIFSFSAPEVPAYTMELVISPSCNESRQEPRLPSLLQKLDIQAQSGYETGYVVDLRGSVKSLQDWRKEYRLTNTEDMEKVLTIHRNTCHRIVKETYSVIVEAVKTGLQAHSASSQHWPRLSPTFFLQRLSRCYWKKLPECWKNCLVQYGVAITRLQRADRLLRSIHNSTALISELRNSGHTNWQPKDQPESLLMEIESDIMIRPVQEQIAMSMRSPGTGKNAVMQLNMGEGKSSVIVPTVAAALADGTQLTRVIVGKPQSKQMYQMLVSKLSGLLNRRIYHMPFSRAVKIGYPELEVMKRMFDTCMNTGGILLVQPEHILSFKLMGIECLLTGKEDIGCKLVTAQDALTAHTRDIVDESDENFSVKFELVYTMGTQRPTEYSPERWVCIHQVLDIVSKVVSKVYFEFPSSIEIHFQSVGCFPQTRILQPDAAEQILIRITEQVCATGLNGFPITRQPEHIRKAVCRYIAEVDPAATDIAMIEDQSSNGFWTGVSHIVLLLRGLVAGGVLSFAFANKRWRVDYGLDASRQPATKLAVPYRAKDNPSPRSEFSHPDVVILLTSLSYYYGGLSDEDLFLTFNHLLKSDQAELEYGVWVRNAVGLDSAFKQLVGINLEDHQCTQHVFKKLRYVKAVIDYFLAHIVFPKEMKEFPHKLSASGWDMGEVKRHPTTGFSGTNDSRKVLPLDVEQLDLEAQKHTNALVLEHLLQPENSVTLMPPRREIVVSVAEMLIDTITKMEPQTHVILDVGAQILELDNFGVVKTWLRKTSNDTQIQAAVYFDGHDELCVLDRGGNSEPLQTSPFASQLDVCLVFLDEAHTRGTDLKLPKDYRAAVTLGANLTKDRLVQACMRMRMLGAGQSVVFCVPEEIQGKIQARNSQTGLLPSQEISVMDILAWAIGETWRDIHRSMALWANQGRRNEQHQRVWAEAKSDNGIEFTKSLAEKYLEDEAQTLERRYRPRIKEDKMEIETWTDEDGMDPISLRCSEFKNLKFDSAALQEEEERELSPEIEQEREDQRPAQADPAPHDIHKDMKLFVSSGTVLKSSRGYRDAFTALRYTTAGTLFNVYSFQPGLLVSADFERAIKPRGYSEALDSYQRTVQWVLTSTLPRDGTDAMVKHMMVISPYEAQELMPKILKSKVVALHLYAPRSSLGYRPLDMLDLHTVPEPLKTRWIPKRLVTELNLFAGQLYFDSFEQYMDACNFLGISWKTPGEGEKIAADGFIIHDRAGRVGGESGLSESPVTFFKVLHTQIRRNCQSIDKTHMGKMLGNQLLEPEDFDS
ncbi:hypothetical protein F4804DRAFT_348467 [Jackrogersella minutella]|nr:hypothetical protein F4804DRAFT_348467 [Jackrogersella minutella]